MSIATIRVRSEGLGADMPENAFFVVTHNDGTVSRYQSINTGPILDEADGKLAAYDPHLDGLLEMLTERHFTSSLWLEYQMDGVATAEYDGLGNLLQIMAGPNKWIAADPDEFGF